MSAVHSRSSVVSSRRTFRDLVPSSVRVAESAKEDLLHRPTSYELAVIADASNARRVDFLVGRSLAREALAALGIVDVDVEVGPDREPVWPEDVVGSITHAPGYRAAVVAHRQHVRAIGIDVEAARRLPAEVVPIALTPQEIGAMSSLGLSTTVTFSMKESVYKAVFGASGVSLDLHEATVDLAQDGNARIDILTPSVPDELRVLRGRWVVSATHVLTAIVID